MKSKEVFAIVLAILVSMVACRNETKTIPETHSQEPEGNPIPPNLPDSEAGDIVKKVIDFAGGWEQWKQKKTLSYIKNVAYYDSMGNKVREFSQLHQYRLRPNFRARISWEEEGTKYEMIYNGQKARKLKGGEVLTGEDDTNSAWNSSFGSHYVMCMPFKLTDPGTILSYEGLDTLANNRVVHSIKAMYEKGAGSAGGMHTWWYYFDKDTFMPVANYLDYGDGFSYTQYESFKEVDGLNVSKKRNGFSTNKERDLLYLSTEYTNENIVFNEPFEDTLFNWVK